MLIETDDLDDIRTVLRVERGLPTGFVTRLLRCGMAGSAMGQDIEEGIREPKEIVVPTQVGTHRAAGKTMKGRRLETRTF